jgi:hypothetical protein
VITTPFHVGVGARGVSVGSGVQVIVGSGVIGVGVLRIIVVAVGSIVGVSLGATVMVGAGGAVSTLAVRTGEAHEEISKAIKKNGVICLIVMSHSLLGRGRNFSGLRDYCLHHCV